MRKYTLYILTALLVCFSFLMYGKKQPVSKPFNRISSQSSPDTVAQQPQSPTIIPEEETNIEIITGEDAEPRTVVEMVVNYGEYGEGKQGVTDTIRMLLYPDADVSRTVKQLTSMMQSNAYDSLQFHRVINNFMIQAGDPASKAALPGQPLGAGGIEGKNIKPTPFAPRQMFAAQPRVHKYGAVAMARVGDQFNLQRDGSTSQFYIVTDSTRYTPQQITQMASGRRQNLAQLLGQLQQIPDSTQRLTFLQAKEIFSNYYPDNMQQVPESVFSIYAKYGGAPYLDEDYTVIGEVISGMKAVQGIQHLPTDAQDRPKGYARILSTKVITEPAQTTKPIRNR